AAAAAEAEDPVLLRRARYAAIVQLAGMVITMAGLIIDGKMTRFFTLRFTDWAANNIFFFGALSIALISRYPLRVNRHAWCRIARTAGQVPRFRLGRGTSRERDEGMSRQTALGWMVALAAGAAAMWAGARFELAWLSGAAAGLYVGTLLVLGARAN